MSIMYPHIKISRYCKATFLFALLFFCSQSLFSQISWEKFRYNHISLKAVQALSSDTIFAVGQSGLGRGILIKTNNGFATMDTIRVGFNLSYVRFFDDQNGIVGDTKLGPYITSNGGVSWTLKKPSIANGEFHRYYFVNPDTGYIGRPNGEIFRTDDGGDSWNAIRHSFQAPLISMQFSENGTGYVSGGFPNATGGNGSYFYYTRNSGQSWDYFRSNSPGPMLNPTFYFSHPDTLLFTSSFGQIKYTTDAGDTWMDLRAGHPLYNSDTIFTLLPGGTVYSRSNNQILKSNLWSLDSTFFNPMRCDNIDHLDVSNEEIISVGRDGEISKTTGVVSQSFSLPFTIPPMRRIHFLDSTNGLALSESSNPLLSRTTNGGLTWNNQCIDIPKPSELAFWDSQKGLITSSVADYVLLTTDGGYSWVQPVMNNSVPLELASWGSSSHAYAVKGNKLMKSTDGGFTWNPLPDLPNTYETNAMHFISQDTGIVAVRLATDIWDQVILRTDDGGMNWRVQYSNLNSYPTGFVAALDFPSKMVGYGLGSKDLTLKTTDGGISWTQIAAPTIPYWGNKDWIDVKFQNELVGFRSCNHKVSLTVNGGHNWTSVIDKSHGNFQSLSIPDSLHTYVVFNEGLYKRKVEPIIINSEKPTFLSTLKVFPIPARKELHLKSALTNGGPYNIRIRDLQGHTLKADSGVLTNRFLDRTISLTGLKPGIYFLSLEFDGEMISKKIIVEE